MLAYAIMKTARNLKYKLDKNLLQLGITSSQFAVLNQIEMANNKIAAKDIAARLGNDRPTVSAIIRRLEKNKFICKEENPLDRRLYDISLTDQGLSILEELRRVADNVSNEIFSDLTEESKNILIEELNLINRRLENKNE